ncbi:MAG: hypothetical protein CMJ33_08925 [Phycisphaerae bacterium]|nr:hypothetical protein [Phycisphaerae bacterium]
MRPTPLPTSDATDGVHAHSRYHGMDFIRAVMMLLGVVLHTALVFEQQKDFWVYQDPDTSPFAGLFALLIHIFRMPVFFVMAGFFGAMLFVRRGAAVFAGHRFERIVIPLVIGWFVLYPLLMWSLSFALTHQMESGGERSILGALTTMSWSLEFQDPGPMHLWFLYYLVYYYVFFAVMSLILRSLARPLVRFFSVCVQSLSLGRFRWFRLPALTLMSFPLMLTMTDVGLDTPLEWTPSWNVLGAYALYFGVGWVCYHHRELIVALQRFAWTRLLGGVLLLILAAILSIIWHLSSLAPDSEALDPDVASLLFVVTQFVQVAATWLLVMGLTGVCERVFRRENPVVRYLVDASYWIYLMHLPLTIFVPACFRFWNVDGTVKMFLMMVLVTLPLLICYHLLVRGTVLGVVLSGRRYPVWPLTGRSPVNTE